VTDATWIGGAVGLLAVPSLFFFWMLLRKAVSFGFFLFYAAIGTALAYLGLWSIELKGVTALPYAVVAGFAFASVCSAIRARIARLVSIIFIIAMVYVIGWRL
jgi:hypothetical protein